MKKSEYNRSVIENFILFFTHETREQATEATEAIDLYEALDNYIEEDHCDGVDGDINANILYEEYQVFKKDTPHGTRTVDRGACLKTLIDIYGSRIKSGELSIDRWLDGDSTTLDCTHLL